MGINVKNFALTYYCKSENKCKPISARTEKREEEEEEQTLSPFTTRLRKLVSSKRKHRRENLTTTRDIFESFFLIIRRLSLCVVAFVIACSCGVEDVLLKREFRV